MEMSIYVPKMQYKSFDAFLDYFDSPNTGVSAPDTGVSGSDRSLRPGPESPDLSPESPVRRLGYEMGRRW
jgi:hypothetical protein